MDFKDIKQYTSIGNYQINLGLRYFYDKFTDYINEGLVLSPDFQRGHVWNRKQQEAFIEFILKGGKSARVIYLNHPNWLGSFKGDFVVVDGLQRITALMLFFENKVKAFGYYYKEFTGIIPGHDMLININNLKIKAEVLRWYIELNEGGTPHTKQEIERVKEMLKKEVKNG